MALEYCENCGQRIGSGDLFCLNCGHMVGTSLAYADGSQKAVADALPSISAINEGVSAPRADTPIDAVASVPIGASQSQDVKHDQRPAAATSPGFCSNCGTPYRVGWSYCMLCGQALFGRRLAESMPADEATNATVTTQRVVLDDNSMGVTMGMSNDDSASLGNDAYDDAPTTIYGGDDDMDAPTIVFDPTSTPSYSLVRITTGERYEISMPAVLGKGSSATVRIAGSGVVSRQHAKLYVRDGQVFAEDLGSTNGTLINGNRIQAKEPFPLNDGDTITLADEELEFYVQ